MFIASQKRKDNIAEYLLYMWQIEDIIRANGLDIDRIKANVIIQLTDLHLALLKDPRFPEYTAEFYKTLPFIVELRSKAGGNPVGEIETCFNALYGMLMLRLQSKEITPDTQNAVAQITKFLARYYVLLSRNSCLDNFCESRMTMYGLFNSTRF